MLTEVGPNKMELYGRIILQVALCAVSLYFISIIIHPKGKHHFHEQKIKDWLFGTLFLILNIGFFIKLYLMPFWVIIDDELKTLEIKYLILKSRVVRGQDITAYQDTTIKSRSESYFGIYVYLSNGNKILFSDLNLLNYTPIETFLSNLKIKKLDEE